MNSKDASAEAMLVKGDKNEKRKLSKMLKLWGRLFGGSWNRRTCVQRHEKINETASL